MKENTGATPHLNIAKPSAAARADLPITLSLQAERVGVRCDSPQPPTPDAGLETRGPGPETSDAQPATSDAQPPPSTPPRGPGAPLGNQNARVHGFYSKKAPFYRQEVIDEAAELEGLDAEIAFMRSCLQYVSEMDPPNPKLAGELVRTLSIAMVRRKYAGHNVLIDKAKRILGNVGVVAGVVGGVAQVVQAVKK